MTDALVAHLRGLPDDWERRFARFDHAQRAAIYAFALVQGTPESNEAWGRVFEAEQAGPRADWFAIFNP